MGNGNYGVVKRSPAVILRHSRNGKSLAANDPITVRYSSRCGAIRVEALRGTITKEFAAAAKALAKEHKQLAASDPIYAAKQYIVDMERGKLYADTDKRMK